MIHAPGSAPLTVTEEDVAAVLDCYRSGWLTMGPRTAQLEEQFAALVGTRYAVAVSSGTAAKHLALLAAGVGPGDEVLVPGLDFEANARAVRAAGARPVPCDVVGADDHNVDAADVAARWTAGTKAVLATHRWGYACDVSALRALCDERGAALVEDCSQAVMAELADGSGRRAGSAGLAGCFAFSSGEHLYVGEGGMVTTDDPEAAARVRALRSHAMTSVTWDRHRGHAETYDILDIGFNYRLDEPRAALGLSRLPRLADDLARRRDVVRTYRAALADLPALEVPWPAPEQTRRSTHYAFGVLLAGEEVRDVVRDALSAQDIPATTLSRCGADAGPPLDRCDDVAARSLVLPLHGSLGPADVERVVGVIRSTL